MKLAVSFLCYNETSAPYLPEFLESLGIALRPVSTEFLVLAGDNSDQAPFLNQELINNYNLKSPFPVQLLSFGKNLGFAAAYNRLISEASKAGADYFLMLNPDMLLDSRMIVELLSTAVSKPDLAALCPKIYRWDFSAHRLTDIIDSCGINLSPGLRFYDLGQGEKDSGKYDEANIFGPSGAAALFCLSALEKIRQDKQYFDENFFMYKEDCDLAYRLHFAGFKTKLVSSAIAYHDRSSAGQGSIWHTWRHWRKRSRLTRSWSFVNQHLLFIKHARHEGLLSRLIILARLFIMALFSLILAPFLLKSYFRIWRLYQSLD